MVLLVGALGGVFLTSLVALATAILNHRWQTQRAERQLLWEHARQLRQERRETYAQYWTAWNRLNHQLRGLEASGRRGGRSLVRTSSFNHEPPKQQSRHGLRSATGGRLLTPFS